MAQKLQLLVCFGKVGLLDPCLGWGIMEVLPPTLNSFQTNLETSILREQVSSTCEIGAREELEAIYSASPPTSQRPQQKQDEESE
uniref:RIKEN cDNA 6820408C15 gene n=1 Tax=Mus musculus TaxID=10090 RepID=D6RI41_MOUSE